MNKKVLVVDDTSSARQLVCLSLGTQRYSVVEADDGMAALNLARDEHPDLVILDVMLPSMDGFDVCRQLKDDPETAETPVLMLSIVPDRGIARRGKAAGAVTYLTKPFSPANLARGRATDRCVSPAVWPGARRD